MFLKKTIAHKVWIVDDNTMMPFTFDTKEEAVDFIRTEFDNEMWRLSSTIFYNEKWIWEKNKKIEG